MRHSSEAYAIEHLSTQYYEVHNLTNSEQVTSSILTHDNCHSEADNQRRDLLTINQNYKGHPRSISASTKKIFEALRK